MSTTTPPTEPSREELALAIKIISSLERIESHEQEDEGGVIGRSNERESALLIHQHVARLREEKQEAETLLSGALAAIEAKDADLARLTQEREELQKQAVGTNEEINSALEYCAKHIALSNDFPWEEEVACALNCLEQKLATAEKERDELKWQNKQLVEFLDTARRERDEARMLCRRESLRREEAEGKHYTTESQLTEARAALRFIHQECDWEEVRPGSGYGGDNRIGEACAKALLATPTRTEGKTVTRVPRVKIIACSDALCWYADKIGQEFDVFARDGYGYWVRTGDAWNTSNFIRPEDAAPAPQPDSQKGEAL